MNNFLRHAASCLLALVFASTCAALSARAQSRDLRVVKAVAGGVNYVSGDVKLQTPGRSGWQGLTTKDDLRSGDVVKTGTDGRVEVLLNPGSYLRLGVNSEFELTDASLDSLRLKLYKGSAVVEATGYDGMPLMIALDTPQTTVSIVRRGIYRINVTAAGQTEVAVQKGRALVGKRPVVVKSGEVARVGADGMGEVAKLDKKNLDELDLWSKERAKELAKINSKLQSKQTRTLLSNADFGRFHGRFGSFGGNGVWVYDARNNCYTFLPFYGSWYSPYGNGYGSYYPSYPCYSCGRNNGWNTDPWGGFNPGPSKSSYPQTSNPSPAPTFNNPMPATRGNADSAAPSAPAGRSKP